MATADLSQSYHSLDRRVTSIEAERQHMATKADVADLRALIERQSRQFLMWLVGTGIVVAGVILSAIAAIIVPLLQQIIDKLP